MSDSPTHYATIDRLSRRLTILFGDEVVAETESALLLKEVSGGRAYDPVYYIPRSDIRIPLVMQADPGGFCPLKGRASRWDRGDGGAASAPYFGWSYETPFPAVEAIRGHVAFNRALVTFVSAPAPG